MPLEADGRLCPVSQLVTLTGTPGPDPVQQSSSHPHAVIFDPSGEYVIVPDKGFDKTFMFRFADGRLDPTEQASIASKPGAAPRHTTFHPIVADPLREQRTRLDRDGVRMERRRRQPPKRRSISTIPDGHDGRNTTAEIAASPCGRFLYVSNRGQDSVVLFQVTPGTGRLTYRRQHADRRPAAAVLRLGPEGANGFTPRTRTATTSLDFVSIRRPVSRRPWVSWRGPAAPRRSVLSAPLE